MANLSFPEQALDLVEITGAMIEKSAALVNEKEAQEQKCAKLIPAAAQALLDNGRIEPTEKEAAVEVLKDPAKVLEILIKTAQHRNDAERSRIGQPVDGQTKKASANYNSLTDGYVGRRHRPGESESDKALKRGLGIA